MSKTVCNAALKAARQVKQRLATTSEDFADMTGLNAAMVLTDFANAYARTNNYTKDKISQVYQFKHAATDGIDNVISQISGGTIKNIDMLKATNNPFIVNGVLERVNQITMAIIRDSSNQKEFSDSSKTLAFRGIIKGIQWANATGMGTQKFISGWAFKQMIQNESEEFGGFMFNADFIAKQNLGFDAARGKYVNAYKKIETNIPDLYLKFRGVVADKNALKGGLTVDAINRLMKNFDQDVDSDGHTNLKKSIEAMIDNGDLIKLKDESTDVAVNRMSKLMENVYQQWKMFNYGTADTNEAFFQDYYKNWENYKGSYLNHIIQGGSDFVKSIYEGRKSGAITKEVVNTLSSTEKTILDLFSIYIFKDDEEAKNEFKELTGITVDPDKAFRPRKDYVPYLQDTSMKSLFDISKSNSIPFAKMLSERRSKFGEEDSNSNLIDNFSADIESYRSMMTKSHEMLYARSINDIMINDVNYKEWRSSHEFEHNVMRKWSNNIMSSNEDSKRTQSSKTVEMFRQGALALLATENAVTLMMSGPKNLIQGMSTLMMNKNINQLRDMWTGKLSIKNAKSSNESIDKTTFAEVAEKVDVIANNMISGRRAEVKLYDASLEGAEGRYAKAVQFFFDFAEKSNQFGILAPFKALIPGTTGDSLAGNVTTNAGSEMWLRNFRKHELFSMIGFEFHADKMLLESDNFKDKEAILAKWNTDNLDNTIRGFIDKYSYDLYEKDNRYFGDFGSDTKPLWTQVSLHDGDTIAKVAGGFVLANWYMFRQAGNFGLMTGLMSTAKAMGEGIGSKSAGGTSSVAMPATVLTALIMDQYNTFFSDEYTLNVPLLGALNQMQDIGVATKAVALLTAPMFNFNISKQSSDKVIEAMARWGGGMFAGKTLQSLYQDIDKDLAPLTTMFQSMRNYGPHLTSGIYGLATARNSAQYREANDYIKSAYQFTFPALDNVLGGNNDVLRMALNSMAAISATGGTIFANESDKLRFSQDRNQKIKKVTSDLIGYNIFEVNSGMKMFEKKVADATEETYLGAFGMEETINPGTHNTDDLMEAAQDLQSAGGFQPTGDEASMSSIGDFQTAVNFQGLISKWRGATDKARSAQ